MRTLFRIAAGLAILVLGLVLSTTWVLVEVEEKAPDGVHIFVPAPLGLARLVVPFLDEQKREIPVELPFEELDKAALAVLDELGRAPDFELFRLESASETVVVAKQGTWLTVEVDNERERVSVRVPLSTARELIETYDAEQGVVRIDNVLAAAGRMPSGKVVDVREPDTNVRIWVW